jgi:hypothetical protein
LFKAIVALLAPFSGRQAVLWAVFYCSVFWPLCALIPTLALRLFGFWTSAIVSAAVCLFGGWVSIEVLCKGTEEFLKEHAVGPVPSPSYLLHDEALYNTYLGQGSPRSGFVPSLLIFLGIYLIFKFLI